MNSDTTYSPLFAPLAATISRHGTTPKMLKFITIYRQATSKIDSSSARGMFRRRIFHLIAQKTNVVVAPVIVGGDQHRAAEPVEKAARKGERARRKVERQSAC